MQGAKKIKIFDIKKMNKAYTWEDESNSINFFEEMCSNLTVKFQVKEVDD